MSENEEFYWLVGLLEGEGSFMKPPPSSPNAPRISINMTDEDVIARVAVIFKRKYQFIKSRNINHKDSYRVTLSGKRAIEFMIACRHIMSKRRQRQIDEALSKYDGSLRSVKDFEQRKLTLEDEREALCRIAKGESLRSVAKSFGVCHETIRRYRNINFANVEIDGE
jgi:hypothetical protein